MHTHPPRTFAPRASTRPNTYNACQASHKACANQASIRCIASDGQFVCCSAAQFAEVVSPGMLPKKSWMARPRPRWTYRPKAQAAMPAGAITVSIIRSASTCVHAADLLMNCRKKDSLWRHVASSAINRAPPVTMHFRPISRNNWPVNAHA